MRLSMASEKLAFPAFNLNQSLLPPTLGAPNLWSLPRRVTLPSCASPVLLAERMPLWGPPSHGSPAKTGSLAPECRGVLAPSAVPASSCGWPSPVAFCSQFAGRSRLAGYEVSAQAFVLPGCGGVVCVGRGQVPLCISLRSSPPLDLFSRC
jgi:hypothetical protein